MGAGAERPALATDVPRIGTHAARTAPARPEEDSDVAGAEPSRARRAELGAVRARRAREPRRRLGRDFGRGRELGASYHVTFRAEPTSCFEASKTPESSPETSGNGATAKAPALPARTTESPRFGSFFPEFRGERGAAASGSRRARGGKKAAAPKRRLPRELSWLCHAYAARRSRVSDAFVRYATRSRLLTFLDYASRDLVLQGVDSSPRFASHRRATGATGTATAGPVPAPLGNTGCLFAHCMELLCTP